MSRTVDDRLDLHHNALNAIRLGLAGLVIISHSFPISGAGADPEWGGISLGTLAVGGFFTISGFLITGSRLKSGIVSYGWRRFLRIFPGFWVCLFFTAFIAAWIGGQVRGGWTPRNALRYVVTYADMSNPSRLDPRTLAGAPFPLSWNGSLWSLRYEVACYVVTGVALFFLVLWSRRWVVVAAFALASAASLAFHVSGHTVGTAFEIALLVPYFLAGATILRFADRLELSARGALVAAAALGLVGLLGQGEALAPLPLAYLLIWIGAGAPSVLKRVGAKNDISYGMYLYAFPVQQLLVVGGVQRLGIAVFTLASVVSTVPMAVLSWFAVERPAMLAKHLPARWRRGATADVPVIAPTPRTDSDLIA